jgi:hypothetical protein
MESESRSIAILAEKILQSRKTFPVSSEPTREAKAISTGTAMLQEAQPHEVKSEWRQWRFEFTDHLLKAAP